MKCFHHNDMDGRSAASLVAYHEKTLMGENFIELDYSKEIPVDIIKNDETVYIVDYSFSAKTKLALDTILEITPNVIWIDHHQTSMEFIERNPEYGNIKGIRSNDRCGAYLTYQYLFPDKPIPRYIELIDDYDRWVNAIPESQLFKLGIDAQYDQSPTSALWAQLFFHDIMSGAAGEHNVDSIINEGRIINRFTSITNKFDYDRLAFRTTFRGHRCIVINKPGNSKVLCDILEDPYCPYEFGIVYQFNGERYKYSIYGAINSEVDCSKIAEAYGGGGHKKAAGFTTRCNLFEHCGIK